MDKLTIYYSPKYHDSVTHLDRTGRLEYYLDSVIKPLWLYESLKENKYIKFIEPRNLISENDLLKVHCRQYIESLRQGTPLELAESSGLRWVPDLFEASLSSVNGFYSSALQSLEDGISGSLSTNFHHAEKNYGSGFCVLNGTAIVAKKLVREKIVSRVLILDCDYHYGDGSAKILKNDESIQIFDVYADTHSHTTDVIKAPNIESYKVVDVEDYFSKLEKLTKIIDDFKPEIVLYDAGMDVWMDSRIGRIEGMNEQKIELRESFVFKTCKERHVPVAFIVGGGYVKYKDENGKPLNEHKVEENKKKLSTIHTITFKVAIGVI